MQQLGKVAGVKALAVGSITAIADTVRVTARLISTGSGRTIAAAAMTIPKSDAIAELLGKPVVAGALCASRPQTSPLSVSGGDSTDLGPAATYYGIRFAVKSVQQERDRLRVLITATNTTSQDMRLFVPSQPRRPAASDSNGNSNGPADPSIESIAACGYDATYCAKSTRLDAWTSAPKDIPVNIVIVFYTKAQFSGSLNVTFNVAQVLVKEDETVERVRSIPLSFARVPIGRD